MKLAVFFPGIGYHCDKPLLYYAKKLAQQGGYEKIVSLSYSYEGGNIRGDEVKMRQAFDALYAQAEKNLAEIDFDAYSEIVFVSKSVGTIIASAFAQKRALGCRHILYTPLAHTFGFEHMDAIAFIGTSDPWSNVPEVKKLSESQHVPMHMYEHANHSLETEDTLTNLEILQDVMKTTWQFLNQ